tara:strand:- start:80326 stop:80466 length:141 start_codon:yes stop_codon:yes gene_type:complete
MFGVEDRRFLRESELPADPNSGGWNNPENRPDRNITKRQFGQPSEL